MSSTAGPLAGSSSAAASMRGARPEGCPTRSARRQRTTAAKWSGTACPERCTHRYEQQQHADPDEVAPLKLTRHLLKEGTPGTRHTACESTREPDLQSQQKRVKERTPIVFVIGLPVPHAFGHNRSKAAISDQEGKSTRSHFHEEGKGQ